MKRTILPIIAVAALMSACVAGSDFQSGGSNQELRPEIRLTTGIKVHTRAAYTAADMQIPAGEQVHVWIDQAANDAKLYDRTMLTSDGSGNLAGGNEMFFPADQSGVNIYALHTNASLSGTSWPAEVLAHAVATDQSGLAGYAASDLLYARVLNVAPKSEAIPLTFNHLLSKLRVAIVLGEGVAASDIASVTIGGMQGGAELTLDKTTAPGSMMVSATGAVQNIAIGTDVSANFDAPNFNDAIIVPQTVAAGTTLVTVRLTAGNELIYRLAEETTFVSGKKYALNMTVSKNEVALESEASDWEAGESIEGNVAPDDGILVKGMAGALAWKLSTNGTLTISGEGEMPDYNYSVGGGMTRASGDAVTHNVPWHPWCDDVTTITIGEGVTSVGDAAFAGMANLTSVSLPSTIESIGKSAFCDCAHLVEINTPDALTTLEQGAFDGCLALANIPEPAIDGGEIQNSGLKWVLSAKYTLLIARTSVGSGDMPDYTIEEVDGVNVTNSPWDGYREAITAVVVGKDVIGIGEDAFFHFSKLTSVKLPESLKSIGNNAFGMCVALPGIKIPAGVVDISSSALGNCHSLTNIEVAAANPNYSAENGVLFNKTKTTLVICAAGNKGAFTIPSGITKIEPYSFFRCLGLTQVIIPQGVTTVEFQTFSFCEALESVDIPASVTAIQYMTFDNCPNLANVICRATTPPVLDLMGDFSASGDTLHVPASSVAAYQADAKWSAVFDNIVAI